MKLLVNQLLKFNIMSFKNVQIFNVHKNFNFNIWVEINDYKKTHGMIGKIPILPDNKWIVIDVL